MGTRKNMIGKTSALIYLDLDFMHLAMYVLRIQIIEYSWSGVIFFLLASFDLDWKRIWHCNDKFDVWLLETRNTLFGLIKKSYLKIYKMLKILLKGFLFCQLSSSGNFFCFTVKHAVNVSL